MPLDKGDRLGDLYATPVGRDVIDKILLQAALPRGLVRAVSGLRLRTVSRLTDRLLGPGVMETVLGLVNAEPDVPLTGEEVYVDFDLAYTRVNEKRIEKLWIDLIFEGPQMNQVTLRDLTVSRRPRAEL